MSELRQLINAYDEYKKHRTGLALAQIVHVDGSSYRRPGARMLITSDGRLTGAISGGCLESDVIRKAQLVIHNQTSLLIRYDTHEDEDFVTEINEYSEFQKSPGCEGIITIAIFPVNYDDDQNPIEILRPVVQQRESCLVCTAYKLRKQAGGTNPFQWVISTETQAWDSHVPSYLIQDQKYPIQSSQEWENAIQTTIENHQNSWSSSQDGMQLFCEYLSPAIHLIIAGTGPDAGPLAEYAKIVGWQITLVDNKAKNTSLQRVGSGCQVLKIKADEILEKVSVDSHTCFVLLTHNYYYDKALLPYLLRSEAFYIGMIGPKTKSDRMLKELQSEFKNFHSFNTDKLHCPAGLDIRAESPQEIALSIISEILGIKKGISVNSLRNRTSPIHTKVSRI